MNPLIPMGAITSSMTRKEVRSMMDAYAEQGIEQYLFYARGGCTIEFMSEEWLELCENIVLEAERCGIKVWLYDEYDCPSGTCARSILRDHPEFTAKAIRVTDGKIEITHENVSYVPITNLLDPEAVGEFMNRTYEKLYARLGKYFGSVIIGIFTDEPGLGGMLRKTVENHPYTDGIEIEYRKAYGEDLFEGLISGDCGTLINYYQLLAKRFRENYIERIASWCRERGILFTGHLLEEVNLRNACRSSGNLLSALRAFSLPGMDEIFTHIGFHDSTEWITLGTILSAKSENGALAELGAFGPCDQPLSRFLQMIRLAAMFGVDHYVCAVAGADMKGSTVKSQWLHPTNYIQPHFACYREFGLQAKQAAELARKDMAAEVVILYPADDAASRMLDAENEVDSKLLHLVSELTRRQYQWRFILDGDEIPNTVSTARYDSDIEEISRKLQPAVIVTDENGAMPDEVLVRRYTDGTVCVLDLSDGGEKRTLFMNGKPFLLEPRGLHVTSDHHEPPVFLREIDTEMTLSLDRGNIHRCIFSEDRLEHRFCVEDPVCVRLYVRSFKNDADVYLDGKRLTASICCGGLTKGFRELYCQTEEMTLLPGEHTIAVSSYAGSSEFFLPSVLICGEFSEKEHVLCAPISSVHTGDNISDRLGGFSGKLTYEFDIVPDKESRFIEIDGFELCLKVYADGLCLGTRICAPYRFALPQSNGQTSLHIRIEQYTTIGPVFGKRDDVLGDIPHGRVLYQYFPGRYSNIGIRSITLLR